MVCAPESAIMSVIVRLFFWKSSVRRSRLKLGSGMFPDTWDLDEMRPSRRPSSTMNLGPPDCALDSKGLELENLVPNSEFGM